MNENLTTYVAKRTMELKEVNVCLSFVSTIWRDKPILITYNNLSQEIADIMLAPILQEDDMKTLNKIVKEFLT